MTVVDGRGFDTLVSELAGHIATISEKYGLSQKMATKLVRESWRRVELKRNFRGDPALYVRERLDEQIKEYVRLSFHTSAGFTEEEFRDALEPLVKKTIAFFAPPAGHPIIDGEFTCFLVLPLGWGCSLRSIIGRCRAPLFPLKQEVLERVMQGGEVATGGCTAPQTPYVLAGIQAGRGLKDLDRATANKEREKFGLTYFSAREMALLFTLYPKFLQPGGEGAIALGEKFAEGRHLHFSSFSNGFVPDLLPDPSPSSLQGVGKPHYARMITP
jgi:hypothetical protein